MEGQAAAARGALARAAGEFRRLGLDGALLGGDAELHISNIHRREAHYHHSYALLTATAVIADLGAEGYPLAVKAAATLAKAGG